MKKFIANLIFIIAMILSVSSSYAAQRMRDMSLSVEDTNRQLATPQKAPINTADPGFHNDSNLNNGSLLNNNDGYNDGYNENFKFDPNAPIDPDMANQIYDVNAPNNLTGNSLTGTRRSPPTMRGLNQQGFINKFCSSGYSSQASATAAQQSCIDTQRQEACERFGHTAVNIQRVLSQAIDCEANSSGYTSSDCDGMDASRLDMLKQYWQDEETSYTILFLPDMVLNSVANCTATNRQVINGTTR